MARRPSFLSLFSGCGGLDLGFEQAGFKRLRAFDIDPAVIAVHNAALTTPGEICDLTLVTNRVVEQRPDVVIAGPPCQGFSTLGKRRVDDPRNSLIVTGARLAVAHQPRVVVLENVSGAMSGEHARD